MRKSNAAAAVFLSGILQGCSPQQYFYYPTRTLYVDPEKVGLHPDLMQYPSANGKKLTALYFKTDQKPKGTVVHFHGNYGNVSSHFPLAVFLLKYGYDVLAFDYQGYGASEGKPTPENLVNDGISSVRFAQEHLRTPGTGVAVFGQSLGGAAAIVVAAKEPLVRAIISEAAFSSHREIARKALREHWFTWPFSFVLPFFANRSYDPIRYVASISPRPIFFIHGDQDTIIPLSMSQKLYEKAAEPKKLLIVPGAGHLGPRQKSNAQYEKAVSEFLDSVFIKGSTPG